MIITTVSLSYFCWLNRKRKSSQVSSRSTSHVNIASSGSSDQTDASSLELNIDKRSSNNSTPIFDDNNLDFVVPGSHMRDSEPAFSDHDMSSTQVTPIYWSASQLLSKLDEGSPYPSSYQSESYGPPFPGHMLSSRIVSPRTGDSVVGPLDYSHHRDV